MATKRVTVISSSSRKCLKTKIDGAGTPTFTPTPKNTRKAHQALVKDHILDNVHELVVFLLVETGQRRCQRLPNLHPVVVVLQLPLRPDSSSELLRGLLTNGKEMWDKLFRWKLWMNVCNYMTLQEQQIINLLLGVTICRVLCDTIAPSEENTAAIAKGKSE